MKLIPDTFTAPEWASIVERFDDLSLLQTYEHAEAKSRCGAWVPERVVLEEDGVVVGAAQAVVKRLPLGIGGLAWVNRAPLHRSPQTPPGALPRMLDAMRRHWVVDRGLYLRLALPVTSDAAIDAPGFRATGSTGWAGGVVDITRDEDALLMGLRQKWRNCLYKAQRLGTEVVEGTDDAVFGRFLAAYAETLENASYKKSTTPELLAAMQALLPPEGRMTVFEARTEQDGPCAWVLVHRVGTRSEYMAAVTHHAGRKVNAGQLLLWSALCAMKRDGATVFDVSGYDPDDRDNSGPGRFKHGLNPTPYRLADELEARRAGPVPGLIRRRIERERTTGASLQPAWRLRPTLTASSASVNLVGLAAASAASLPA